MKLRIFGRPALAVGLLGLAAALLVGLAVAAGWLVERPWGLVVLPVALFYLALFALAARALARLATLERWIEWSAPQRLLILAPHEDDCVISAGGIGARNHALGGTTRIVYLAPDEHPGLPERRAEEARAAWREAGLAPDDLLHLDLLPRLREPDPQKLRAAGERLRAVIDDFKPTVLVMPMFEGGHVHHDMVAGLIASIVTAEDRFEIYEAPEYSPYTSLRFTPHRVIRLCARWVAVSYYGPPDGIDARPVLKIRLAPAELERKRRMLAAFVSQNAPSLIETRSYPDRLVRWTADAARRHPFEISGSYLALALAARRVLPREIVERLLPSEPGTIGREPALTDWHAEIGQR
jgi:LmbE family N-acetylglucosaminyl deacetylase